MAKGDLVCISQETAMYDQPVGVGDQVGGIRHYAGLAQKGQTCVVLSDPDDWKATPLVDWSSPWSRVLLSGRVVWVKSHFLAMLVQTDDGVVY
jgi:hypothetical protein